jgi:formate dehydrogenase subunit gamma
VLAVSFIILGLTGLALLYGRPLLIPVFGREAFAAITAAGKILHNYLGFAFMVGLALTFVMWLAHNFPNRHDLIWIAKGGGLFTRGVHPPSRKFNAGQKFIFWAVVLLGLSLSLSGIALLFPFEFRMFSATFEVLNRLGLDLPTELTAMQEMQLSQLWHAIVALAMVALIIAHIYIGTLGMEGAFDAMGTGEVDLNWAREHHDLWAAELEEPELPRSAVPAE